MSNLIYISRNFTEFGGFTPAEIVDFNKRGIISDSDYLRVGDGDAWFTAGEWLAQAGTVVSEAKPVKAKVPSRKTVTASRSGGVKKTLA